MWKLYRDVLDKFKYLAVRSFIYLKTLQRGPDRFQNLQGGPWYLKTLRGGLDKFKNFAGRSLIKLKYLQRAPLYI